jgi:curved DNA-binding protein CbpA
VTQPRDTSFDIDPAILEGFVRVVATAGDSPTVISRVAENAAYVDLCRTAVAMDAGAEPPPPWAAACRKADITLLRLQARLHPVAQALHLVPEEDRTAYYRVLGVRPGCDAEEIRRAYRRRARELHPDLAQDGKADHQAFAELTRAYATLSDPVAKEAYDTRHSHRESTWYEPNPRLRRKRTRQARFTAVIVVVLLLVAASLVLDQLDRARVRRNAFQVGKTSITRTVAPPETPSEPNSVPPARNGNTSAQTAPGPLYQASEKPSETPSRPDSAPPVRPEDIRTPNPAAARSQAPETPPVPLLKAAATAPPPLPKAAPETPVPEPAASAPEAPVAPERATPPPPAPAPLRLLIFHAGSGGRRLALLLANHLILQGYPPPKIEPNREALHQSSNVRYFNSRDDQAARTLQRAVQRFLASKGRLRDAAVRLKDLSRRYPLRKRGLMEIWINTGTTPAASAQAPPAVEPPAATDARVRAFLDDYCRTYEARDPERLAALFAPAAIENGRPFKELLPRYRANMAQLETLSYTIDMDRWRARSDTEALAVEGRFTALGRTAGQKEHHSQGTILLDIVPVGEGFRVTRLEYRIEQEKRKD